MPDMPYDVDIPRTCFEIPAKFSKESVQLASGNYICFSPLPTWDETRGFFMISQYSLKKTKMVHLKMDPWKFGDSDFVKAIHFQVPAVSFRGQK